MNDSIEANLARNRLLDEGLNAVLSGDITNNPIGIGYSACIDLLVPAAELERARSVLQAFAKEIDARKHRPDEAISAEPPVETVEDPFTTATFDEKLTRYAYRAALMGFIVPIFWVIPIVHQYSFFLLMYVSVRGNELR